MTYLCIKPRCPPTCDSCNHAVLSDPGALLADSIDRMRVQTNWMRNGALATPFKAMAFSHMEAILAHIDTQAREIEALRADAERYRWLREQHWTDKTLCVIRPADLPRGVQTFSLVFLDDAIRVRRMSEAGG